MTNKNNILHIQGIPVSVVSFNENDYICITDMAKAKQGDARAADVIKNWIRTRSTLEFIGTWELLYNPDFKVVEFDHFKMHAGLPSFVLSVSEWIEKTHAAGMVVRSGRYGGTYAHKDIAFEFGSAISPVFKLYLIKEYQRLKEAESNAYKIEWNVRRILSKANYLIHTDAIQQHIIPQSNLTKQTEWLAYAEEADLLNVALFGYTAKQWREANPALALEKKNLRDYATINQLAVLSNLETHNAELIKANVEKVERFRQLSVLANYQINILYKAESLKSLHTTQDKVEKKDS
jgi:hypothetical protein